MTDENLDDWGLLARSVTYEDRVRQTPPPDLWDKIEAAAGADLAGAANNEDEIRPPEKVIDLTAHRDAPAPSSRRKQTRQLILAGAASILAIVLAAAVLSSGDDPVTTFVADVTNAELPEPFEGTATANLAVDDTPVLEISFDGNLPMHEPVEIWLIKTDPEAGDIVDMHSLGIVDGDATSWSCDWPTGLDPNEYSVVDISIEPDDGDPTHSGRSILRGQLTIS